LLSVLTQCWLIADSQREATIDGDGLPCHVFGLGEVDHQRPHVLRGLGDSLGQQALPPNTSDQNEEPILSI